MSRAKEQYEQSLQRLQHEDKEYEKLARQDDMSWWQQQNEDEQRMNEQLNSTTGD